MKDFEELLAITSTLHGPEGCPWDKKQTFQTLRPYILEEAHELLEAVDKDNTAMMVEELGDVLFQIVFFGKLGEKAGRFTLQDIIHTICEKLVRRHPHVFGDIKVDSLEEVYTHWERIKSEEKKDRTHPLDGIPPTLGALPRAQKIIEKMIQSKIPFPSKGKNPSTEESFGDRFLDLIIQAQEEGIDGESALRSALKKYESLFS